MVRNSKDEIIVHNHTYTEKRHLLYNLCKKFIEEQEITCGESVYQTDRVIENAYELIENICDIVGYYKYED